MNKIMPVTTEDLFNILFRATERNFVLKTKCYIDAEWQDSSGCHEEVKDINEFFTSGGSFIPPDMLVGGCIEIAVSCNDEEIIVWHCEGNEEYISSDAYSRFIN